jgi:integrase
MARVRKRGSKYQLDYYFNGKRERITFDNREEAKDLEDQFNALKKSKKLEDFQKLIEARLKIDQFKAAQVSKTLNEAIVQYFNTCSKNKDSVQSAKNDKGYFKALYQFLHFERDCYYLADVTPVLMDEYQGRLKKNVSASTVVRTFATLNHFFSKCVDWGYLQKSPTEKVKLPKVKTNPRKTWADDETQLVIEKAPKWVARPLQFFADTGARPIEFRNVRFCDWDPLEMTVSVCSQKNAEIQRKIFLTSETNALLLEIQSERGYPKAQEYIFLSSKGRRLDTNKLTRKVRAIRRALGLAEGKVPYGLRHTFATKLVRNDVATGKVQRLMGHKKITTTEKYLKLNEDDLRQAVDDLSNVLAFRGDKKKGDLVTDGHEKHG